MLRQWVCVLLVCAAVGAARGAGGCDGITDLSDAFKVVVKFPAPRAGEPSPWMWDVPVTAGQDFFLGRNQISMRKGEAMRPSVHVVSSHTIASIVCISDFDTDSNSVTAYIKMPQKYFEKVNGVKYVARLAFGSRSQVAPIKVDGDDEAVGDVLVMNFTGEGKRGVTCCGTNQVCFTQAVSSAGLGHALAGLGVNECNTMVASAAINEVSVNVVDVQRSFDAQEMDCPAAAKGGSFEGIMPRVLEDPVVSHPIDTSDDSDSEYNDAFTHSGYLDDDDEETMYVPIEATIDCANMGYLALKTTTCASLDRMGCRACLACNCNWSKSGDGKCHQPIPLLSHAISYTTPVSDPQDEACIADERMRGLALGDTAGEEEEEEPVTRQDLRGSRN